MPDRRPRCRGDDQSPAAGLLFDEAGRTSSEVPKAIAAANRLARINSSITIEPNVADCHAGNIEELISGRDRAPVDMILDGTDNAETRYLINDAAVKLGIPWIYGACVGMEGRVMSIRPGVTPCLRCIFPQPPGPGELPTCDTAGVFAPAAAIVASLQVTAAIKLQVEPQANHESMLTTVDVWTGRFRSSSTLDAKRPDCIACGLRRFEFLDCITARKAHPLSFPVRPEMPGCRLKAIGRWNGLKLTWASLRRSYRASGRSSEPSICSDAKCPHLNRSD